MIIDNKIRLAAWNTWSGVAVSASGETIVPDIIDMAHRNDFVSLYEVHYADKPEKVPRFDTSPIQKGEIGPYHLTLGNELHEQLYRTHSLYFTPNFTCHAYHDRATAPYPVHFGNLLIVRRKRFKSFSFRNFFCYGVGELNSEVVRDGMVVSGLPASRAMQVCCVEHGNHKLRLVFLHGIWTQRGKVDCPPRSYQNSRIALGAKLGSFNEDYRYGPTIVMGDLNYTSRNECFADLLANHELFNGAGANLNAIAGITDSRTHYYTKPEREADFALMSEQYVSLVDSYEMLDARSDHRQGRLTLVT